MVDEEGLTLDSIAVSDSGTTVSSTTTNGVAKIGLTDILGERDVTVSASISAPGAASATSSSFGFGKGPLGAFSLGYPNEPDKGVTWSTAPRPRESSPTGP